MEIFNLIKTFPADEKYSLCDQIKRSSRSVCACISEAYRKRMFEAHFMSKLSDADMENSETQVWLDYALACKYINKILYKDLLSKSEELGKMLNYTMHNPEKFNSSNLVKKK